MIKDLYSIPKRVFQGKESFRCGSPAIWQMRSSSSILSHNDLDPEFWSCRSMLLFYATIQTKQVSFYELYQGCALAAPGGP